MAAVNAALRALFDALLYPFRDLHPLVGLALLSLVTAAGMLWIFKRTSDQERIAAVKRQIHAGLFEIRLFNDDLRAILRAQGDILRHNLTYLRLALVPMVWILVPVAAVMSQAHFHYAYRGLEPEQPTLLKVELGQGWNGAARPAAELMAPEGLRVEAGPVWIPAKGELAWRIAAERPGDYEVGVRLGGATYAKTVRATGAVVRRSPVRPASAFLPQLLYTAEPPLPAGGPVRSIAVGYPPGSVGIPGWESELTWILLFFALSIAFAFVLRKPFKVNL